MIHQEVIRFGHVRTGDRTDVIYSIMTKVKICHLRGKIQTKVQCNLDLVTSYLMTNPDLVTILQKTIFLVHKNISFSDNLVFSAPSI